MEEKAPHTTGALLALFAKLATALGRRFSVILTDYDALLLRTEPGELARAAQQMAKHCTVVVGVSAPMPKGKKADVSSGMVDIDVDGSVLDALHLLCPKAQEIMVKGVETSDAMDLLEAALKQEQRQLTGALEKVGAACFVLFFFFSTCFFFLSLLFLSAVGVKANPRAHMTCPIPLASRSPS